MVSSFDIFLSMYYCIPLYQINSFLNGITYFYYHIIVSFLQHLSLILNDCYVSKGNLTMNYVLIKFFISDKYRLVNLRLFLSELSNTMKQCYLIDDFIMRAKHNYFVVLIHLIKWAILRLLKQSIVLNRHIIFF